MKVNKIIMSVMMSLILLIGAISNNNSVFAKAKPMKLNYKNKTILVKNHLL